MYVLDIEIFLKIFQYNRLLSLISSTFGVCQIAAIMCAANRLCSGDRESDVTTHESGGLARVSGLLLGICVRLEEFLSGLAGVSAVVSDRISD